MALMSEMGQVRTLLYNSDKTFIRRIERGFDFLGYHFGPAGLSVAVKTVEQFVALAIRLYEQEPREALASARLGLYVRRWVAWAGLGIGKANCLGLAGSSQPTAAHPKPGGSVRSLDRSCPRQAGLTRRDVSG